MTNRRKTKSFLSFVLALCLTFTFFVSAFAATDSPVSKNSPVPSAAVPTAPDSPEGKKDTAKIAAVLPDNWMGRVDGQKKISEINIPGTHDSATEHVQIPYIARCQDLSIKKQLESGFRYLDVRLQLKERKKYLFFGTGKKYFVFKHGPAYCRKSGNPFSGSLELEPVLEDCYGFLKAHPSETIVFCVKQEWGKDDTADFQKALSEVIEKHPEYWYTENRIPTLDEARGKIVLARRFDDKAELGDRKSGLELSWKDQGGSELVKVPYSIDTKKNGSTLVVQDRFEYDTEPKWTAFKETAEAGAQQEKKSTVFINFLSTKGPHFIGHPLKYAETLNRKLREYDLGRKPCGWIVIDYGTEKESKAIYSVNLKTEDAGHLK